MDVGYFWCPHPTNIAGDPAQKRKEANADTENVPHILECSAGQPTEAEVGLGEN